MIKVFLDSSVLVAASGSISGASAFILGKSKEGDIRTYVSLDVIGEARKNIKLKMPKAAFFRFTYFLKQAKMILVPTPTIEETALCENYIEKKDAPILAAAKKSRVSHLVTLDRKHFFTDKVKAFIKP
ncbi:PIN domain-containing protein, partial [Candidatus Microgenomates bacterium]|nr:PIN domain-containing protein [Candidatus Microgenomates bacterium]